MAAFIFYALTQGQTILFKKKKIRHRRATLMWCSHGSNIRSFYRVIPPHNTTRCTYARIHTRAHTWKGVAEDKARLCSSGVRHNIAHCMSDLNGSAPCSSNVSIH